jgi:protocatechuate 3,4-dioxygenase beta subunit
MNPVRVVCWLCLGAPMLAQTGLVEGRVVSTASNQGVPKARVVLRSKSEVYLSTTDGSGAFRLVGVEPGTYTASADRTGWVEERPAGFQVLPAQRVADVVLRLTPTGVIAGRVLDADGDPVSNVRVQAVQLTYARGRRSLFPAVMTSTNDRGEYRLFGLRPGTYFVRAVSGTLTEISAYYPSGTSFARATELELPPGGEFGPLDLRIAPEVGYGLTVRLSQPMSPEERSRFSLRLLRLGPDSNTSFAWAGDTKNEVFRAMRLAPGRYAATAQKPDPQTAGGQVYWQQIFEVVDRDVELTPVFRPAFDVPGTIEGAPVKVSRLELVPEEPGLQTGSPVTPAGGTFTFRYVLADSYTLRVTLPDGGYLKGVYADARRLESQRIDFERVSGRLRIVLGTDGAEFSGLAVDAEGRPVPHASIALAPVLADWPDLVRTAIADENGNFRLENIAPGNYRLFAWRTAPSGGPECPEFRASFEAKAFPLSIEANSDRSGTVKVF